MIDDPLTGSGVGAVHEIVTDLCVVAANLKEVVERDGPLDWQRAARFVSEVARQLDEVHRAEKLHGNVRPGNIYLESEPCVVLGNVAHESMYASIDEEIAISVVDCLAPEQAVNSQVDGRADIYSLGCTFYFLLAGRMPFPSGSIAERLLQHQTGTPQSLSSLRPDVPGAIVAVCEKMMAKKPNDRYATAKDVVDVLAKMQAEG